MNWQRSERPTRAGRLFNRSELDQMLSEVKAAAEGQS